MNKVIIIGAGPSGLEAAITCKEQGLDVLVLDEYMIAGGRLLGQLYEQPDGTWWNGLEESKIRYEKALELGTRFQLNTPVNNIVQTNGHWTVYTDTESFTAKHLLLATGAAETPVPVPGWTMPGVMSVGAAQVMTNVHRVKPGNRGVIIGVNVLSAAIAMELKLAGIEVVAMTLPVNNQVTNGSSQPKEVMNSLLHVSHMAPSKFIKLGSRLMKNDFMKNMGVTFFPKNGVKIWDIPIQLRKAVVEIYGDNEVQGVIVATIDSKGDVVAGSEEKIKADFVCIAGGLYPLAELAAVAGCSFYYSEELGGYVPLHSERMETNLDGLYVAGNITGIEGAKVAIAQGKTAGLTIAHHAGIPGLEKDIQTSIESIERARDKAYIQFHPGVKKGKELLLAEWQNRLGE